MRTDHCGSMHRWLAGLLVVGSGGLLLAHDEQSGGFYARGGPGVAITSGTDLTEFFGPVSGVGIDFDTGFAFSVAAGYDLMKFVAVEVESGLVYNAIDQIGTVSQSGDAAVMQVPMLANRVLQLPNRTGLVPFGGAGVGGSLQVASFDWYRLSNTYLDGSDSDLVFAWQGFAGLRYEFKERISVGVTYRYLWADEADWEVDSSSGQGTLGIGRMESHSVTAQVRYRF